MSLHLVYELPVGNLHTSCHWCLVPCFDSASKVLFDMSAALYQCSLLHPLVLSHPNAAPLANKPNEGLWAADLCSGFWSFCSQCVPSLEAAAHLTERWLTTSMREKVSNTETVLNLLNIFAVIYAPLPHGRVAIHRFNTLYVKGKSCTGITHHIKGPVCNLFGHIHVWSIHIHTELFEIKYNVFD